METSHPGVLVLGEWAWAQAGVGACCVAYHIILTKT